jgi:hypothetical protein
MISNNTVQSMLLTRIINRPNLAACSPKKIEPLWDAGYLTRWGVGVDGSTNV